MIRRNWYVVVTIVYTYLIKYNNITVQDKTNDYNTCVLVLSYTIVHYYSYIINIDIVVIAIFTKDNNIIYCHSVIMITNLSNYLHCS